MYLLVPQGGYFASLTYFLLILAHVHTSVFCPTVSLFPCICCSVVVHTPYHVFLCTILLPVLGMLILCGLFSRQIVGKVCTCYLSLCTIFLSHNILFIIIIISNNIHCAENSLETNVPRWSDDISFAFLCTNFRRQKADTT